MIALKVDSVHWSPNETSLIVKFAEPVLATDPAAAGQALRCYVRVPLASGQTLLSALKRAHALLTDTTVAITPRKRPLN